MPDQDLYIELTTLRPGLMNRKHRKLRRLEELYPDVRVKLLNRRDFSNLLSSMDWKTTKSSLWAKRQSMLRRRRGIHMANSQTESIQELENDIAQIIVSQEEIMDRVNALGKKISEDYNGKDLILVGVLRGVLFFMADLMRSITIPVTYDFMAIPATDRQPRLEAWSG